MTQIDILWRYDVLPTAFQKIAMQSFALKNTRDKSKYNSKQMFKQISSRQKKRKVKENENRDNK